MEKESVCVFLFVECFCREMKSVDDDRWMDRASGGSGWAFGRKSS